MLNYISLASSNNLSFAFILLWLIISSVEAKETTELKIISSSDPGSNQVNSFIVVPENQLIPEGIKRRAQSSNLSLQSPFVIELTQPPSIDEEVVWKVVLAKKEYGAIELLSNFEGREKASLQGFSWQSSSLDSK